MLKTKSLWVVKEVIEETIQAIARDIWYECSPNIKTESEYII